MEEEVEAAEREIEDMVEAEMETSETTGKRAREKSLENEEDNIFWVKSEGEKRLATINLVPGNQVYREKLVKIDDEEFRIWDPYRSKLGAAIMNGLQFLPIVRKVESSLSWSIHRNYCKPRIRHCWSKRDCFRCGAFKQSRKRFFGKSSFV